MNIREAKQEIIDTVHAYLRKDETGAYEIPTEKQRPILMIGPPGIGKTAIMEQVAHECGINLVSYTITHHTRQSAIGLPYIREKNYGGRKVRVTEYTMSEIVASIYDQIERSGISEGILFLDEINCVSETLAPTMLQFLQYKTFGTHKVPDGFIIVTAGNPPQYNKSVRDLDIVTWDRVRRIDLEPDFEAWKEYAYGAGMHGAILAFLEIHSEYFYRVQTEVEGRRFVTARGWEDLSRMIFVCEKMGKKITEGLVVQYIQDAGIARDFAVYYELYEKYRRVYRVPDILAGHWKKPAGEAGAADASNPADAPDQLRNAPFDEKLSLLSLLEDSLGKEFRAYEEEKNVQKTLLGILQKARTPETVEKAAGEQQKKYEARTAAHMLDQSEKREAVLVIRALDELQKELSLSSGDAFACIRTWFSGRENERQAHIRETGEHLTNSFAFLAEMYGEGQEMVLFLSALNGSTAAMAFVRDCDNDAYYRYNKLLLLKDRGKELREQILALQ